MADRLRHRPLSGTRREVKKALRMYKPERERSWGQFESPPQGVARQDNQARRPYPTSDSVIHRRRCPRLGRHAPLAPARPRAATPPLLAFDLGQGGSQ
jgi:hypothetical protein